MFDVRILVLLTVLPCHWYIYGYSDVLIIKIFYWHWDNKFQWFVWFQIIMGISLIVSAGLWSQFQFMVNEHQYMVAYGVWVIKIRLRSSKKLQHSIREKRIYVLNRIVLMIKPFIFFTLDPKFCWRLWEWNSHRILARSELIKLVPRSPSKFLYDLICHFLC